MKNFKRISYIILIVIIIILSLIIYFSVIKNNDNEQDKKGVSEIRYVESKLVDLINSMNNIESRNYKISVSEISKETSENSEESSSGSGSNSGGSSSSSGGDSSGESGSQSGGGEGQGENSQTSGGSQTSESSENQDSNKKFELTKSGVLTNDEEINWDIIQSEVENMYTSIPTITIDLYQLNLNQEDILNFNKEYDNLTIAVKSKNKKESLSALSKVYDFMPKFIKNTSEGEEYKKVLQTKSDIFKAYSKLDTGDWGQIESDMNNAIQTYSQLLSNTNIDESKQYDLSRGYIMLNELQNAAKLKDTEVFLIKYKNLIEELNSI